VTVPVCYYDRKINKWKKWLYEILKFNVV
jgi:hypothetical protein